MSGLGWTHLVFALLALTSGAWVLRMPKGTRWHRTVGHLYATSMLGLNATALAIYRMTGTFGVFHALALVSLGTLGMAMWTVLARRPRGSWIESHAIWMGWSYNGLAAAAVSETATRFLMPWIAPRVGDAAVGIFWTIVGVATFAVIFVGARLIKTRTPAAVAAAPEAMRRERARLRARESGPGPVEDSAAI